MQLLAHSVLIILLLFPYFLWADELSDLKKDLVAVQAQMETEKANAGFVMRELNAITELRAINAKFTALQQKKKEIKKRIKALEEKVDEKNNR